MYRLCARCLSGSRELAGHVHTSVVSHATPFPAAEERLGAKVKAVPGRGLHQMTTALPSLPRSAGWQYRRTKRIRT